MGLEHDSNDLDSLQGILEGQGGAEPELPDVMEIQGHDVHSVITTPEGKDFTFNGEFKLDGSTMPKQIDWIKFHRPDGTEAASNLAI